MLIELAIGDAYGAGFEYADPDVYSLNTLAGYVRHRRHKNLPGTYTDDTQMSLAVAEAIGDDAPWTAEELAQRFVTVFKRDPREGYGRSFYQFLLKVHDGCEFLDRIRPDSDKSGAAMRAAPIGVFPTPQEVRKRARVQAAITHDTPDGIHAAQAAALAAHFFLYKVDRKEHLGEFIVQHVPGQWNVEWTGKVRSKGWMSVRAAITAIRRCDSMSELLETCIAFTGDVDTVAAIALGAASGSSEIQQDLPPHLLEQLENGPFGRRYIKDLDRRLLARVSRPSI